jgi:hypothetical protein
MEDAGTDAPADGQPTPPAYDGASSNETSQAQRITKFIKER